MAKDSRIKHRRWGGVRSRKVRFTLREPSPLPTLPTLPQAQGAQIGDRPPTLGSKDSEVTLNFTVDSRADLFLHLADSCSPLWLPVGSCDFRPLAHPGCQHQLGSPQPRLPFHPVSYRVPWPRQLPWLQASKGPSWLQLQWPQAGPIAPGSFLCSRLTEGALKPKLWLSPAHWHPWPKAAPVTPGCRLAV